MSQIAPEFETKPHRIEVELPNLLSNTVGKVPYHLSVRSSPRILRHKHGLQVMAPAHSI